MKKIKLIVAVLLVVVAMTTSCTSVSEVEEPTFAELIEQGNQQLAVEAFLEARETFEAALEMQADDSSAIRGLAEAARGLGEFAVAAELYISIGEELLAAEIFGKLALESNDIQLYLKTCGMYTDAGSAEKTLEFAWRTYEAFPDNDLAIENLISILSTIGDDDALIACYLSLIGKNLQDLKYYIDLIEFYFEKELYAEAYAFATSNTTIFKGSVEGLEKFNTAIRLAPPADYIIEDDYKDGNGLMSYNKVCQIGDWIYYALFENIYRMSVNGAHHEQLYTADIGLIRGNGAAGLMQSGEYLVFLQGSCIYKMNLLSMETEVLVSAENETTCFKFAVADDVIYFVGVDYTGGFIDGVYKISIDGGSPPEQVVSAIADGILCDVRTYNNQVYYSTTKGIYSVNPDGTDKKRVLGGNFHWLEFVVSDGYIYFTKDRDRPQGALIRIDINGENMTDLASPCFDFIIRDEWIIYCEYSVEEYEGGVLHYYGNNIYKMRTDGTEHERIFEGVANLSGASGNWVYFSESITPLFRVRLDGTGEMSM